MGTACMCLSCNEVTNRFLVFAMICCGARLISYLAHQSKRQLRGFDLVTFQNYSDGLEAF